MSSLSLAGILPKTPSVSTTSHRRRSPLVKQQVGYSVVAGCCTWAYSTIDNVHKLHGSGVFCSGPSSPGLSGRPCGYIGDGRAPCFNSVRGAKRNGSRVQPLLVPPQLEGTDLADEPWWQSVFAGLLASTASVSGQPASASSDPAASGWQPWVLSSPKELQIAPPAEQAPDLQQLHSWPTSATQPRWSAFATGTSGLLHTAGTRC